MKFITIAVGMIGFIISRSPTYIDTHPVIEYSGKALGLIALVTLMQIIWKELMEWAEH